MKNKIIKLTESDLHRIVKESVNTILNEIGDTESGQSLLGRLAGKKAFQGKFTDYSEIDDYAKEKRAGDPKKREKFNRAFHQEKDKLKDEKD